MRILILTASLLILTACGQKGPLYLPEDTPVAATQSTAENTQPESRQREQDK